MKIIFVTCRFPYPLIGGDRTKSFNVIKNLARNHEVHLVSNAENGPLTKEQKEKISSLGIKIIEVRFNKINAILRSLLEIFSKRPLEVSFYNSLILRKSVENLHKDIKSDIVMSFYLRTAETTMNLTCKKILIADDCRVLYQSRSAKESRSLIQKIVRYFEVYKLKKYEPKIMSKFDCVTFVTEIDKIEAESNAKKINLSLETDILTCGVDINEFKPNDTERQNKILFAGKLDVLANTNMAKKIAKNIFPILSKEIKNLSCEIVGGCPPKSVLRLANKNIKIIKNVPSLVSYFQHTGVFVHPHAGASGIQNKLLEAMACGSPSVTTKTGAQGIPIKHGIHSYIAKNENEMAVYTIELLKNKKKADAMSKEARLLMEHNFSWEIISKKMEEILLRVTSYKS